jgi:tetratricopeptide (TPR) repeat protein
VAPAPAVDPLAAALARSDDAYAQRDQPGQLEAAQAALEAAAAVAPGAYAILWRQARLLVWRSEEPGLPKERKSELGRQAWELADRACAAAPDRVEGWFYAMNGVGAYSQGLGIISALTQGMEGKFKDRLGRAERLDPGFQAGAIPTAWGRFWFELPWPKHDAGKSLKALNAALQLNPANVRAHVYLGDLLADEGKKDEAAAAYRAALEHPPGRSDAPEERRWQVLARAALERLEKK